MKTELKPIIAIDPVMGQAQAKAVAALFRRNGYLPVIAKPEYIKQLEIAVAISPMDLDMITRAAFDTIRDAEYDSVRLRFGKKILAVFAPKPEAKP